ncbi:porin family protein [Pontibacter pamirensis]|uniref:hypothetical protein n=1 Tax=Pontibacter pamirensis TaxID=2562824 RepID=UPI00138A2A92|nr:hypothetical protein [Pontibacter pamirensis]
MSINNISDEELDNLFRKSFESFDPPYDPEAWQAMEEKLDRVGDGYAWWFKLFFPLMLIIYTCIMVADSKLAQAPVLSPESRTAAVSENINKIDTQQPLLGAAEEKQQGLAEDQKLRVEEFIAENAGTAAERFGEDLLRDKKEGNSSNMKNLTPSRPFLPTHSTAKETQLLAQENRAEEQQVQLSAPGMNMLDTGAVTHLLNTRKVEPSPLPATVAVKNSVQLQPASHAGADKSSQRKVPEDKKVFLSNLQIAVLVAPDLTTVKFKAPDAVSANAGLLLSVPVTRKLSLVTGVIWANKVYGAKPEDYTPSSGYWNSSYLPASIDATCKVLDIPLNIRYQVLEWNKNSVALQAGVSSYIMLEEDYTYNYATYSRSVAYSNEYRHLFGVQNLSVSYTRKISPVISVGVEPFVKVPLKGVGAGHVKLSSAGVFFTAGYTIRLKE